MSGTTPVGYTEFGKNSVLDLMTLSLTGNTMVRTLGLGAMTSIA